MSPRTTPTQRDAAGPRWLLLLFVLWLFLALRIGVALLRHEPLNGDLALPTVALFCASALLGNWVWWKLAGKGRS